MYLNNSTILYSIWSIIESVFSIRVNEEKTEPTPRICIMIMWYKNRKAYYLLTYFESNVVSTKTKL